MAGPAGGKELYALLGVSRDCDAAALKAAWRARALENHPDKGGDEGIFKQVQEAYEILSDPHKRSLYDAHGHAGLEGGGGGFGGFGGFGSMFGGGGFGRGFGGSGAKGSRKPQKGRNIPHGLKLSLEQLFSGTRTKLAVHRDVVCTACSGSGSNVTPAPEPEDCPGCAGSGGRVEMKSLGRGMTQRVHVRCAECGGSGTHIPEAQQCAGCRGRRVTKQRSEVEVEVEAGTRHKAKIVVVAMGDEVAEAGGRPGDLIVTVHQLDHDIFVRKGDDLVVQRKLTLREALCGCTVEIAHLDGRRLIWKSTQGQVIQHGLVQCIEGEGFPQTVPKQPPGKQSCPPARQGKGRLLVRFEVEFPSAEELTDRRNGIRAALDAALPPLSDEKLAAPFGADTGGTKENCSLQQASEIEDSSVSCLGSPVRCVLEEAEITLDDTQDGKANGRAERRPDGQQCNQQ
jgi:DnaJ family protein A protein 2